MKTLFKLTLLATTISFFSISAIANTHTHKHHYKKPVVKTTPDLFTKRINKEDKIPNLFGIAFYKPNYFLPYYYTGSPANAIYQNNTPHNEKLKHDEMKFQISLKVPIWKDIFGHPSSLYFAYSQLSYWQFYNHTTFIRETDYEPEAFLANQVNWRLSEDWKVDFFNVGLNHQSNGTGTNLERGWNRIYLEAIASNPHWMLSLRPWYIISTNNNNTNIGTYMGYAKFIAAYKIHEHVISLEAYNILESGGKRGSAQLTWSFPLTNYLKGYVQVFSGYGQSLVEYNHRTNSGGIGLSVNDWV